MDQNTVTIHVVNWANKRWIWLRPETLAKQTSFDRSRLPHDRHSHWWLECVQGRADQEAWRHKCNLRHQRLVLRRRLVRQHLLKNARSHFHVPSWAWCPAARLQSLPQPVHLWWVRARAWSLNLPHWCCWANYCRGWPLFAWWNVHVELLHDVRC